LVPWLGTGAAIAVVAGALASSAAAIISRVAFILPSCGLAGRKLLRRGARRHVLKLTFS
jgi:hypothetical protein